MVHRASGFTGRVVGLRANVVTVQARSGQVRTFALLPGAFAAGGRVVTLVRPRAVSTAASRTASGSIAVAGWRARAARASRILVEGIHDAVLVERVWGDDLRAEGVVVERLDGIDHLAAEIVAFGPAPGRRLGVLVDHLVPGTKEARLAEEVAHPDVLVTGTPFVDVWQAVKPAVVGLVSWPTVPKGQDWKTGICRAMGEPDPATCWRRILRISAQLRRPRAGAGRRGRAAHRLRHRAAVSQPWLRRADYVPPRLAACRGAAATSSLGFG